MFAGAHHAERKADTGPGGEQRRLLSDEWCNLPSWTACIRMRASECVHQNAVRLARSALKGPKCAAAATNTAVPIGAEMRARRPRSAEGGTWREWFSK